MYKRIVLFVCLLFTIGVGRLCAQDLKTTVRNNKELDSLRKKEEGGLDSVVFTSKYIRYTTLKLSKDSIQTVALDTSLNGFQNFSVLVQPRTPTVGIGNLGLSAMPMLFEPSKTIGFDVGFHALDYYAMTHDDIKYYQARTPFTSLYYVSGGDAEQVFKVIHSQNIKRNWNIGANFNRIGANGIFARQRGDDLNGTIFSWYQSPNKRYNLWTSAVFNTLKAMENGSIANDSIYTNPSDQVINRIAERVRLNTAKQLWRQGSLMIKQSYFVGRIDSTAQEISDKILPTNKITYTFKYDKNAYSFEKDEADDHTAVPKGYADSVFTNDSTRYTRIQNEFVYSFFLRAKSNTFIKNELKLDVGIRHDLYNYSQLGLYRDGSSFYDYTTTFQNITLLGAAGYRFSNRIDLNVDVEQIFQGRNMGDFLYEAKSNVLLSNSVGRIVLGGYFENKSPAEIYTRYFGNHYHWINDFDRTKTVNLSFKYENQKLKLDATANYYLINNYLYFKADLPTSGAPTVAEIASITPAQLSSSLNLLKIAVGKKFTFGRFHLDSYVVYQKTDNPGVLRTPELYTFNTFYVNQTFFKALKTNVGFDVRYNTPYKNYSYSPALGQFYVGGVRTFETTPIVDVWVKASLRKANLFLKCDYINQGLPINGYYTVNQYPMQDRLLFKFGVQWNFYD
ncbi:MAG: putative porin [Candidatus Pedobacter colombiensis]|uniref:Porin n=1 Tax=Candidatus Pedobacter colombiensis TaxID=3121371 RepID=A0AAJ6B760_9SPHI|nr:putative porin [Pedobacter sp.]WEK19890.1 MAG: putative porin [Pedobacter sp.]